MATHDFGVRLGSIEFKTLSLEDKASLISNFIEKKVKEAVWQCEDGFNFNFIKNCRDILKHDIVAVVHYFRKTGCIPKRCNTSFIALVPKVRDPTNLTTKNRV